MKRFAYILSFSICLTAQAQKLWTADECMQYAVMHNHEVRLQSIGLDDYKEEKVRAIGSFLPAAEGNIGGQYNFGRAIDPETNTYTNVSTFYNSYGLSVGIPVFDGFQRYNNLRAAKANVLMVKSQLMAQKDATAQKVLETYTLSLYNKGCIEFATQKRAESEMLLRQTKVMAEVGQKGEAELAEKQNLLRNTHVAMQQDKLNNETENASLEMDVVRKRRAFEQNERLYKEKLISKETYLQAKEDYELSQKKQTLIGERLKKDAQYRSIQMEQMEDNLSNMQRNVVLVRERKSKLEVRSTIDGELGLLDVALGQSITPGQTIGQVNDLSDFKIEAQIDEHYIDRIKVGLSATFERDGKAYDLLVRKVYPEVRQGKFRTDLVFSSNRPGNIRSGQTYYLNLELGKPTQAVLIPKGTFFQTTGGNWIFVLDKSGTTAYRRNIRIGRQNPQYYEVEEGLEPGERIITSGYEVFKDNEILKLK